MSYAGRLDPMASGKLLLLVGDECKRQKEYHTLDKEYEIEVLFGIGSDTGDILGLVTSQPAHVTETQVKAALPAFVGPYRSPYPRFSSKTVGGKPLFHWTLEGKDVEIPEQRGTIHSIKFRSFKRVSSCALLTYVRKKIARLKPVQGATKKLGRDFRRTDVLASWKRIPGHRYAVACITVRTSAGVYMRTLAEDIARTLDTRGLALSIRRTKLMTRK